jgi:8-oxo-dGTP pyrophosphatase MutT (NUDIX family)
MTSATSKSNLDIVNSCDVYVLALYLTSFITNHVLRFPYFHADPALYFQHVNTYYHLRVPSYPDTTLGYLLPSVALTLSNLPDWTVDDSSSPRTVTLTTGDDEPSRSAAVAKTTLAMRETGHFVVLEKWRSELYAVYGPGHEILFTIERSASPLFGVVTYGVHMTVFTQSEGEGMKVWVPRRSSTKQTYPSMLDNSVAGGISAGEEPFESLVRESMEEASLPEDIVRKGAIAAGCVTYFYVRDARAGGETGLLQPECQYVYDLDLTGEDGVVCKPNDDEVEGFELLGLNEVIDALARGEFKPNCAMVMLDFLVRKGVITKEGQEGFIEIVSRLHRFLEFPLG